MKNGCANRRPVLPMSPGFQISSTLLNEDLKRKQEDVLLRKQEEAEALVRCPTPIFFGFPRHDLTRS